MKGQWKMIPLVVYPRQPNGRNGYMAYLKSPRKNTLKDHKAYTKEKACKATFGNTADEAASQFMCKNFKNFTIVTERPYEEIPLP